MSQVYHFEYDNFDNTTSISVGANKEYTLASYVYAAKNGLLTTQTYGNGDNVSFTYDILGRTKTATYKDIDGNTDRVLTYVYTGDGQLYSIHDSSTGYTYLYTYDNIGRLIASCVKLNTTVLMSTRQEYNANNQMVAQHWTVGGTTYSETYTYSKTDGALTSSTNAVGQTLTYNYDKLRRLSSISGGVYERLYNYKDASSTNTTPLVSGYHYKNSDGEVVYSFSYTYDVLGNIASSTDATETLTYTYDAQNQLTEVTSGGTTLYEYTYDKAGNITSATSGATTHTYAYGNTVWHDLLTAYDNQPIAYEGQVFSNGAVTGTPVSGNPISYYNGTRWTFDWEEGRNLVTATSGSNNYTYAYDQNGLRVSKVENGKIHTYLYAGSTLVRETITYTENGQPVEEILNFVYDTSGYPYALNYTANGMTTTYYYITNLQGDVLAMITENGAVVASYSYDPYGKPLDTPTDGTIAAINPLRYRGYYYDAETGFYYLQSRYYDPVIGRFITADDVAYLGTNGSVTDYNLFAYCGNNPVMGYDPCGTWDWGTFFSGASLLSTGLTAVAVAATILTCGAAAPAMVAVAAVTAAAGALTVVNGAAEVVEAATGYNVVRDGAFGGNTQAYEAYRDVTSTVAEIGTAICGSYYAAKGGNVCFIAGTLVQTEHGGVPIEEISTGDFVWAWDEETGDVALKEVVETYINETTELIHVFVDGEEIVTTPSHPFYSPVKGWTDAVQLRAGDILVLVNGEYVVVELVQHEILEAPITVYNFQVEGYHTYYVSDAGVLVHNSCATKRGLERQKAAKMTNTTPITTPSGRNRIPDYLNTAKSVMGEAKSVKYLSKSQQLMDMFEYADTYGYKMFLKVEKWTKISGPLQEAINTYGVVVNVF